MATCKSASVSRFVAPAVEVAAAVVLVAVAPLLHTATARLRHSGILRNADGSIRLWTVVHNTRIFIDSSRRIGGGGIHGIRGTGGRQRGAGHWSWRTAEASPATAKY